MYDTWIFDYDYKYGNEVVITGGNTNVIDEKGYKGIKYFVFSNKKVVYHNYLDLAFSDQLQVQLVEERSAYYTAYLDKNFISDCIIYHVPDCLIGATQLKQIYDYKMTDQQTVVVDPSVQRKLAIDLFHNDDWKVSFTQSFGKIFSKVVNLIPNQLLKT